MVDKKIITTTGIALIVGFMISLGVDVSVDTVAYDQGYLPYSCDLESVDDYMCYKLSRVGETTGVNYYCYYDRDRPRKQKACKTGWKRIKQDCPEPKPCICIEGCTTLAVYTDYGKAYCDPKTLQCIDENLVEAYLGDLI